MVYEVMTAKRARAIGEFSDRAYGYVVLSEKREPARRSRVVCWCKTKAIATGWVRDRGESEKKGYCFCPCGSGKQSRVCCG